jgi:hypothetical protein
MNDKVTKFLETKRWALPFTETDLLEAIQLGRDLTIKEISDSMILLPVNGKTEAAITETMLRKIDDKNKQTTN